MSIIQSTPSADAAPRPGRPFTVASYLFMVCSFVAPAVLAGAAIALGLIAESRGDKAGRTAAIVAGAVLVVQVAFFALWAFGIIRLPI